LPHSSLEQGKSVVPDRSRRQGQDSSLFFSALSSCSEHLLLPCTISNPQQEVVSQTLTFVDSGATTEFCDSTYASSSNLPVYEIPSPKSLTVADGRLSSAGLVTHATDILIDLNGHTETRTFYITNLGRYQILLGKPWLRTHNPSIDWSTDTLTFDKASCSNHYETFPLSVSYNSTSTPCPRSVPHQALTLKAEPSSPLPSNTRPPQPRRLGAAAFYTLTKTHPDAEIFSLSLYEVDRRLQQLNTTLLDDTPTP